MNFKQLLLLVSFIEGGALMSAELISSKLIGPYYGSSLIVWTSVFVCTLSGLALGYFLGGFIAKRENLISILFKIIIASFVLFGLMHLISRIIMEATLSMPIELGSLLSVLIFLFPLLMCFGMVSPIILKLITLDNTFAGNNSGVVYTISTLGGIFASLIIGFYAIPLWGIKASIAATCFSLLIALFLIIYAKKKMI